MSETAIGEFIDDGAAQPTRKIIIYERTEVSTNGCENDNQKMFILSSVIAFHAAGGTMTSEGNGINELSIVIKIVTTQ